MNITQFDRNAEASGLLTFTHSVETLTRSYLRNNRLHFNQKMKMIVNGMERAAKSMLFYYGQFNEEMVSSLFDKSKDIRHIDQMQDSANDMIRLYLTMLNMKANGFTAHDMEDAMNRTLDAEPNAERLVSQEFIDSFRVQK